MKQSRIQKLVLEVSRIFIGWINSGKLEIKAYPSEKIHAKLYIITYVEGDRDHGRVITGGNLVNLNLI